MPVQSIVRSIRSSALSRFKPAETAIKLDVLDAAAKVAARLGDRTRLEDVVAEKVEEQAEFARHVRAMFLHGAPKGNTRAKKNRDARPCASVSLDDYCTSVSLKARTVQSWYRLADDDEYRARQIALRVEKAWRATVDERGAHVAHNTGEQEWYTPAEFIDAAREVMGEIDLDPASTPEANTVVQAARFFTAEQDGLGQSWAGRVWLNPPYAQPLVGRFCAKLAEEVRAGRVVQACVLVNNATETEWFGRLVECACAVCFPRGRVKFWHPEREAAAPLQGQAVVYAGGRQQAFTQAFAAFGHVWTKV